MTCATCNQFYNAATESNVCPHTVIASPATEDRATAPERLWIQVFGDGPGRFCTTEIDPRDIHDNGKPVYEYVLADASQKRIAELEAREESAKCLLLRYDALAAPFAVLGESKIAALENYVTASRAKIAELEAALSDLRGFLNVTPLHLNEGDSMTLSMLTDAARTALKGKQ